MINVDIEKEIKQENKILFGLNMRQIICLSVALVISVILALILGYDSDLLIYPALAVGGLCFAFGWKKYDGLPMERVILRKVRDYVYKNDKRTYKTQNRYIAMMNEEYARRKYIDLSNKKILKQVKRDDKRRKKITRKSKMKIIK